MMTRGQIDLVQRSFALVQPMATQAAALFYDKLFERDPGVAPLFQGDMAAQGARLMAMIDAAVHLLNSPVQLEQALHGLGARHARYGVREAHYASVGAALLDTLAAALGERFSPQMREAWAAMYRDLARAMQAGAAAAIASDTPAAERAMA